MNKKDEIYDFLVDRLVGTRYAFGQPILVKELAAETGVSRQPIMTALNRLAADGFVRIVPQVGCQVVSPTPSEIGDFFLMFQNMEGLLAQLAAARRTDEQLAELKRLQRRIVQLEEGGERLGREYATLNRSFHQLVHVMARSPLLDERQRANFNMSDFFINHSIGFDRLQPGSAQEHDAIIDAIDRRSPERARAVMEVHIGSVGHAVLMALDQKQAA